MGYVFGLSAIYASEVPWSEQGGGGFPHIESKQFTRLIGVSNQGLFLKGKCKIIWHLPL